MPGQQPHPVRNAPGVPFLILCTIAFVTIWPWMELHGAARWAVGIPWTIIPWTIIAAAIIIAVIASNLAGARKRN